MYGNQIRKYRTERGLSTRQLGKLVGCHQTLIVRLENGERSASDDLKVALSEFFGVPITTLFFQSSDDKKPSTVAEAAR